jgi:transcription antitermination factor NusA-like protein
MIKVINRRLNIPSQDRVVGFTGDNLVETRVFELNRYYGDVDLSLFDFKLDTDINNVKNIIDLDKSVADDKITLTWTVLESHVLHAGRMAIQLRAFSGNEEKWHSEQDYVRVEASINATEVWPDPLPSEFEEMEQRVTAMKVQAEEAAQDATGQANRAQGIADTFENVTLPGAVQAVEGAVQEQIGLAKDHADRAQNIADVFETETLPAAIQAVETTGQAKVDLAEQQADIAIAKAGEASGYADNAFGYKEAAGESATAAAGSAQTAGQQAGIAAGHAETATTKAWEASCSAAAALASEQAAKDSENLAKGYAEDAAEAKGLIGTLTELATTIKDSIVAAINEIVGRVDDVEDAQESHKAENMPHQFINHKENKTYKFGFQVSVDGKPQIIYEEVV